MKKSILLLLFCLCFIGTLSARNRKMFTLRGNAQYLSTQPNSLEDTCPGKDIFSPFVCSSKQSDGFSCFDIYQVEGDPIPVERYTLLEETITIQNNTAEPACNFEGELTCANFLTNLKYNLDFSWFITNFPSSSFPQWRSVPPDGRDPKVLITHN